MENYKFNNQKSELFHDISSIRPNKITNIAVMGMSEWSTYSSTLILLIQENTKWQVMKRRGGMNFNEAVF